MFTGVEIDTLGKLINDTVVSRKEGNVLFNDALNTFYLRLYGVGHTVKDHSDSKRKEGIFLFNNTQHILFTVIWCQTYGKGPLR